MNMPVDAFLTALYTHVDDWFQRDGHHFVERIAGAPPRFSDSEIITLSIAFHWLGFKSEREFLRYIRNNQLDLFPRLLSQSEFNRRARRARWVVNELRRWLVRDADWMRALFFLLDGTPVHVRHWRRYGPRSLALEGAALGVCAAKKETFYGYKLVFLVAAGGAVVDFVLLPGNADERAALDELVVQYRNLKIFADKGFLDAKRHRRLHDLYGHTICTPKRKNQKEQNSPVVDKLCASVRQLVETAIGQAKECFGLEKPAAKTFEGMQTRLLAKLTGLTIAAWLNQKRGVSALSLAGFRTA